MNKLLVFVVGIVLLNPAFSQVNLGLQNKIENREFSNYYLFDLAFAIEEVCNILEGDSVKANLWLEYVKPIGTSKEYSMYYIKSSNFFLEQLENKRAKITEEAYQFLEHSFSNIDTVWYDEYFQFTNSFVKYGSDVDNVYMLSLLVEGDESFLSIEKDTKSLRNLKSWYNGGVYMMRLDSGTPEFDIPINCRIAEYLNNKHANSKNVYIKQGVAIFNEFLEKHKGEY